MQNHRNEKIARKRQDVMLMTNLFTAFQNDKSNLARNSSYPRRNSNVQQMGLWPNGWAPHFTISMNNYILIQILFSFYLILNPVAAISKFR